MTCKVIWAPVGSRTCLCTICKMAMIQSSMSNSKLNPQHLAKERFHEAWPGGFKMQISQLLKNWQMERSVMHDVSSQTLHVHQYMFQGNMIKTIWYQKVRTKFQGLQYDEYQINNQIAHSSLFSISESLPEYYSNASSFRSRDMLKKVNSSLPVSNKVFKC